VVRARARPRFWPEKPIKAHRPAGALCNYGAEGVRVSGITGAFAVARERSIETDGQLMIFLNYD
jgi:hypothetical protein